MHALNNKCKVVSRPIYWTPELISYKSSLNSDQPLIQRYSINRSISIQYTGFFVQASLRLKSSNSSETRVFVITTETNIIPESNPRTNCSGIECYGRLI